MPSDAIIIHKYEVIQKIGAGGFSTVYKAKHKTSQKLVALKIVKQSIHAKTILNESKIISYINRELGSNLFPTLHWYGMFGKMTCLATTFYSGSFADILQDSINLHRFKRLDICSQLISLTQRIHDIFVIHCDIKPDNFMINDSGKLVLIDFGMARLYQTNKHIPNKMSETLFGTPKYASYYLHLGNRPSRRDDLISIGYIMMNVFDIDLPWCHEGLNQECSKEICDIQHISNIARMELKQYDNLVKCLSGKYLLPYFKDVYALKYDDAPNYSLYDAIFTTL